MKKNEVLKAVLFGLLLTFILTWPVIWNFFSETPGRGSDTYQALARTALVQQRIEDNGWLETFRWQKDSDFWGLLPLIGYTQYFLGDLGGYNFWWLLSFFLAYLGMWMLARDTVNSKLAAYVSGFIFAFSPFHFSHAVATNIGTMHFEWLPWLAFFMNRFFKNTSWQAALGMAASFILIIATEHQLLAFSLVFLIFYFPFLIFLYPSVLKKKTFWVTIMVGLTVVILVGVVQFKRIWEIAHSENNFLVPPYDQVENYSADLVDFFIPARFQTFWGESFNYLRSQTSSNIEGRQTFYLGFASLIIVIIGIFKIIRDKIAIASNIRKWLFFWLFIFTLFFVLSLGPTLHIAGKAYLAQKLPYYLLYKYLPYWDFIRTVSRINVITFFAWAILAGMGAKYLEKYLEPFMKSFLAKLEGLMKNKINRVSLKNRNEFLVERRANKNELGEDEVKLEGMKGFFAKAGIIAVLLILPIEFLSTPVSKIDLSYSPFYGELAKDQDKYFILEIPGSTSYDFGSYSTYTARIHRKEKIDGIDFARTEEDRWAFQKNTPIIENLLYSLPSGGKVNEENTNGDIIITNYADIGSKILSYYYIHYVTLSKVQTGERFGEEEKQRTISYIENALGLRKVFEDDFLIAYEVPKLDKEGVFLALDTASNDSWNIKEGAGRSRARWAKDSARMKLVNVGGKPANVEISFQGNIKYLRNADILLDGKTIKSLSFKEFKGIYSFFVSGLSPGEHVLEFKITDENKLPVTDYELDRGLRLSKFQTKIY